MTKFGDAPKPQGKNESATGTGSRNLEHTGHLNIHMHGSDVSRVDFVNIIMDIIEEEGWDIVVTSSAFNIYSKEKKE